MGTAGLAILVAACGNGIADTGALIASFRDHIGAADRTMHLESSGTVTAMGQTSTFSSAFDLDGADYSGSTRVDDGQGGVESRSVMSVGGTAFIRYADDEIWGPGGPGAGTRDPFAGLQTGAIEVIGSEKRGETTVARLRATDPEALAALFGLTGTRGIEWVTSFNGSVDVIVALDGRPIAASAQVSGLINGQPDFRIKATIDVQISNWGGAMSIEAPIAVADPFPPGTTFVADNGTPGPLLWRDGAGHELLVPSCTRMTSSTFDGRTFSVAAPASDHRIDGWHEGDTSTWMWSWVDATGYGHENGLPFAQFASCASPGPSPGA